MPTVEVDLRDDLESELRQLVERGEFLNQDQAVEDLLQRGIAAYDVDDDEDTDPFAEGGSAGDYGSHPDDAL